MSPPLSLATEGRDDGKAHAVTVASTDPTSGSGDSDPSLPRHAPWRGPGGTPALADCLWPIMDSQGLVAFDPTG